MPDEAAEHIISLDLAVAAAERVRNEAVEQTIRAMGRRANPGYHWQYQVASKRIVEVSNAPEASAPARKAARS